MFKKKFHYYSHYPQEEVNNIHLDLDLLWRLFIYLKPYRFLLSLAGILLILAKMCEVVVPIGLGYIAQKILSAFEARGDTILLTQVIQITFLLIGFLVASYLLESLSVIVKNWIAQQALYHLRMEVFEHIQSLPIRYFDKHSVGRLMTRTIHDVEQINYMFTDSIVPLMGSLFLFFLVFVGIFWIDWQLGLVIAAFIPVLFWTGEHFRVNQRRCYDRIRSIVSAMNTFVQEHLMGYVTIRLFGVQKNEKQKFEKINDDYKTAYMESLHHFSFLYAAIDFLQSLALIAIFVVLVAFSPLGTSFQVGLFFTFSLYVLMLFRPIADLSERYNLLQSAIAAAKRIFHILDEPKESDNTTSLALEEVESITFEDVWFAYQNEDWVLQGISFHVRRGENIALVGITGSGKTTILSLLLRFYEIRQGKILINGHDIRKYSKKILRSAFAVVLQDPVIFSATIEENISLHDEISFEEVTKAAHYTNLTPFVKRFPEGLRHPLKEQGKDLSVGEKQLISLARAVAHRRTVLILDEATANIDALTERAIQDALTRMMARKTSLVIAHRLSTIQHASKILVIHQGKLWEQGTHKELIEIGGIYEKLYRIQFSS